MSTWEKYEAAVNALDLYALHQGDCATENWLEEPNAVCDCGLASARSALDAIVRAMAEDGERIDKVEEALHGTGKAVTLGGACYWSATVGRTRVGEGDTLRDALDDWMERWGKSAALPHAPRTQEAG